MKILIDNSNLFAGGGIQVATSFINDLKNCKEYDIVYYIIQSPNSTISVDKNKFPQNFVFYDLGDDTIKSKAKRIRQVKRIEKEIQPNAIFVTFGPSYHKSDFPKIVGFAIPYIIYPDSPFFQNISLIEKLKYESLGIIKKKMFKQNSDVLIFETENARQIFCEKTSFKKPTYVVGNTLNSVFERKQDWSDILIQETDLNILYLTANYSHKNIRIIPNIIDEIIHFNRGIDFQFYISVTKEEMKFDDKYDQYITYLGRVGQEKIHSLYSQMDVVLMPTLLEIFSTTYLEAMYMKVPIVASDMEFARDICDNAAYYCSATDAKQYAAAIIDLHDNPEVREKLIVAGEKNLSRFGNSMDRTKKYLEIIKHYAN